MSAEAKVGAFTLGGAALLIAVVVFFGGLRFSGSHDYTLYAGFGRAIGLNPEAQVLLAGVPVGRVEDIASDGTGVTVSMVIQNGVKIPRGSSVTIAQPGIMGDKFVIITPSSATDYYGNGDYLYGADEMGMDAMFTELNKMIILVQEMLTSINSIVGAPGFQTSVVQLVSNMEHMTAHLDGLTATLEQMAAENRGNLQGMLAQMNTMAANLAEHGERRAHRVEPRDRRRRPRDGGEPQKDTREYHRGIRAHCTHCRGDRVRRRRSEDAGGCTCAHPQRTHNDG